MSLKLAEMSRVRVIFPQRCKDGAIETLYEFGAIQVELASLSELGRPLPSFERISSALVRIRALEKRLNLKDDLDFRPKLLSLNEALLQSKSKDLAALEQKLSERDEALDKEAALKERAEELKPFVGLKEISPSYLKREGSAVKFSFFALKGKKPRDSVEKINSGLKEISHSVTLTECEGKNYCLLSYDRQQDAKASEVISENAVEIINIPTVSAPSFAEELNAVEVEIAGLAKKKVALAQAVEKQSAQKWQKIVAIRKSLEVEAVKATLPLKFGVTKKLAVLEGWVKKKEIPSLEAALEKSTGNKAVIETSETIEEPPAVQDNPKQIAAFEELVRFFSPPSFNEIDPTIFVAVAFPFFFGMIMGDFAYGAILAAISLWIGHVAGKNGNELLASVSKIGLLSSISAMCFGVLYGEALGFEFEPKELAASAALLAGAGEAFAHEVEAAWPHLPRLGEHAAEGTRIILLGSIVIGILHVFLGFLLGAINNFTQGHAKHAYAKIGWMALEVSLVCGAITFLSADFFASSTAAVAAASQLGIISSILAILVFEGGAAMFEVISLVSNIFSYMRLMAFGISAAVIASLVSGLLGIIEWAKLGNMVSGQVAFDIVPFMVMIVVVIAFVLGHAFALLLGVFEAGIQSVRLNYVEFFTKFYSGGGREFSPLRKKQS